MSTPITSSPKTGWSNASTRPSTPNARVVTTAREFTVKHLTPAEVEEIAVAIDAMTLAHKAEMQIAEARAGIAEARAGITQARAGIAEARVGITQARAGIAEERNKRIDAQAQQAAGAAQAAAGRALATEARGQAAAARKEIDEAKALMTTQLEAIKRAVKQMEQRVKAGDTQTLQDITSLIEKITLFQTNLPDDSAERSAKSAALRAEAKAIQLKISS